MVLETVGSSKSNNIRSLLIKAWRERWTDMQWGIHIKTVLPRYISGDIYHLSDCILQQALMGPLPNQLILSYLRHSLSAHIVSYGGVIETISKYDAFHKPHCVRALLDLLSNMVENVTCRGKPEDCLALASSLVAGVKWLLKVIFYASGKTVSHDQLGNLRIAVHLLSQYMQSQYLMGLLRIARLEDPAMWNQVITLTTDLEAKFPSMDAYNDIKETIIKIFLELRDTGSWRSTESVIKYDPSTTPICYGFHARILVEAVIHSTQTTQYLANQLLLYKELRYMTEADLYLELLASSFLGLGSDEKFPHQELHWVGFTFIKIPAIIKLIHSSLHGPPQTTSEALLAAVKQLARRTSLLDAVDSNMNCNCLELLLRELKMHTSLLLESDMSTVLQMRLDDPMAVCIGPGVGKESNNNPTIIPNLIIRAEPTVSSILKTLSNKNQESVLPVMNLLISGKSRDLLLTAAAASGKLLSYAQKFVKFNQQSLEPQPGETEVMAKNRALMFDITFLLLCHITQVYGVEVVMGDEEETFIERWMRHHMPDKSNTKILMPQSHADPSSLSEIMTQVRGPDLFSKYGQVQWSKVCRTAPSLMKKLLSEVSQGGVTLQAVTELLDKMCGHLCALPICFTAWICTSMHEGDPKVNALLEILQKKLSTQEPALTLGCFKDRSLLMTEIIDNMVKVTKERSILNSRKETAENDFFSSLITSIPEVGDNESKYPEKNTDDLLKVFQQTWDEVYVDSGILNHSGLWSFQKLLRLGGYQRFVSTIVKFGMENVFRADLTRAMDLVYGIFQIDLHKCCIHLLTTCLPKYLAEPDCAYLHSYHRISALSRLTVQLLVAAWAAASSTNPSHSSSSSISLHNPRKRSYSAMVDESLEEELLKNTSSLNIDQNSVKNLNNKSVALMVALQQFLKALYDAVPKGVINPVNELVVCLLQELVSAPPVLSPLLTLLPPNMLSSFLTLFPPDTFTPSQLLGLALPSPSPPLTSTLSPGQESAARRAAAKLLCIHRNLMLADAAMDGDDDVC